MKRARAAAAMLAVVALTARAEQTKFDAPRANGYRVDACRTWGQGCGKEAADAFCRLNKFESASGFEIDPRIGASTPTMTIEDRKICNQPQCDGFKSITCTRADGAVGRRRGLPPTGQAGAQPSGPPAGQPSTPGTVTVPRGVLDALRKAGERAGSAPPNASIPAPGAPRAPRTPAALARLDPAEFVVITPKQPTATLALFGARAPAGELEERRTVALQTTADLVQTAVADVDGDGQGELLLLETPDPLKPAESGLRFLKLGADLTFAEIGATGIAVGDGLPLLTSGRLLGDKMDQALVYTPGGEAVVIGWRPAPATELPVRYVKVQGWRPKGVLVVFDATGDGQDDILDYSETGSLDLVTLGPVELLPGGEGTTHAAARPLLMLGPAHRFGIGDFTGDGRPDLLIHDSSTRTVTIAQFDASGAAQSRTTVATDWPATYSWTRGYDYDGDGSDDLLVNDTKAASLALVRFTSQGTLRDARVIVKSGNGSTENLRFPGYFMANGRASYLSHVRESNAIDHYWFDVVGPDLIDRPRRNEPPKTLVEHVPSGALVVVGNFRKDR